MGNGTNPNISVSFSSSSFKKEVDSMGESLKKAKKEFDITSLSVEATGDTLEIAKHKIEGYKKQAELQRAVTNKVSEAVRQATKAHEAATIRVEAAKQAYDKASKSEDTSKEQLSKLKEEVEKSKNAYEKLGKTVQLWNNKLLDSQKAEGKLKLAVKQTTDEVGKHNKALIDNIKNTQNVTTASGKLINVYTLIKGLVVASAGKTLFDAMIGGNAQFEQYMASFEVLLGGIDKAQKRMDELTVFAAKTPFELPQVVEAEKRLLAYGVAAKDTAKVMQMLGDISMGNAEKLNMISLAYGQVVTNQRLYGTELRQFAENGVPLLAELAKLYGKTEAEMRKMVEDGQIGVDAVTAAMERMTSQGGKFYGMMEKQSKTMNGMLSTLKDNFNMFAREVGEESFEYLKTSLSGFMDEIDRLSRSGELQDIASEWGRNIGKFVEFVIDAARTLWEMKEALAAAGAAAIAFKTTMAISGIIMSVVKAIETYIAVIKAGATATTALTTVMKANPWVLLASAVASVISGLVAYNLMTGQTETKTEKLREKTAELTEEYNKNIDAVNRQTSSQLGEASLAQRLAKELEDLSKKTNKTAEDKARMAQIVDQLNEKIPNLALSINAETGALSKQISVVYDAINAYKQYLFVKASEKKASVAAESMLELEEQKKAIEKEMKQYEKAIEQYNRYKYDSKLVQMGALESSKATPFPDISQKELDKYNSLASQYNEIARKIGEAGNQIQESFDLADQYNKKYGKNYNYSSNTGGNTSSSTKPPPLLTKAEDKEKAAKKAEQERKEAIQKEFNDLKFKLDMEYITEEEYYKKLAALRDKHYSQNSEEWQRYTLDIKQYKDRAAKEEETKRKEALKAEKDSYEKRRQISDQWVEDKKIYGKLTADEEVAAYERIKKYTKEYYQQGILDYSEYAAEIKELDKDIYTARKQAMEEEEKEKEKLRQKSIEALNKAEDSIINALQNRYEKERQIKEDSLTKELNALDRWQDESINRINGVYDLKIEKIKNAANEQKKALQAEIDAIDRGQVLAERAKKDSEEVTRINKLKEKIVYEHNDYNRTNLQEELNRLTAEREKRLNEEQLEDRKDTLKKQIEAAEEAADLEIQTLTKRKEAEINAIKESFEAQKQAIEESKKQWDTFYDEKLKKANLALEAEKLLVEENQKEIIKLLTDYGDQYELAGQTLGEKLYSGFKSWADQINDLISAAVNNIKAANEAANKVNPTKTATPVSGSVPQQSVAKSISVQQTNIFQSVPTTASEIARKTLQASRQLAAELE